MVIPELNEGTGRWFKAGLSKKTEVQALLHPLDETCWKRGSRAIKESQREKKKQQSPVKPNQLSILKARTSTKKQKTVAEMNPTTEKWPDARLRLEILP